MGILQVQFSNTVTVVGEGMTPYMFGCSVIPKNIKLLHCSSLRKPQSVTGCVLTGGR